MEQRICRLVCRMQENDSQAFDELMEFYYPKLLRMAYLISGSYADSEDIVQETFVLCWMNRRKLREPENFYSWLCRTLTREAWRFCRKARREQPAEEIFEDAERSCGSVLDEVLLQDRDRRLYQAVAGLPVKQRTAVVLYYFNQMPVGEIAAAMGCLEGTVKSRLHTARRKLRSVLKEQQLYGEEAAQ